MKKRPKAEMAMGRDGESVETETGNPIFRPLCRRNKPLTALASEVLAVAFDRAARMLDSLSAWLWLMAYRLGERRYWPSGGRHG